MNDKYELTDETIKVASHTLHRIKALKDFCDVHKGDFGGFVESEKNLSSEGDCWVYGNVRVSGNGYVYGHGRVSGYGRVSGNGRVFDNGWVFDNGCVSDNAHVSGRGEISGHGFIKKDEDYAIVQGFGTEHRSTTFFRCKDGRVRVQCGCFYGTINQFRKQVKKTREGKIAKEYLLAADMMEVHFAK